MHMLKRVHHINFVVRDIEQAQRQYAEVLGLDNFEVIEHPARPVRTARTKLGDTWLVLVQPLDTDSPPARHLAEHGEGFFLISYEVDDLDMVLDKLVSNGVKPMDTEPRPGILNWKVSDLSLLGARVQLVEEIDRPRID